MRAKRYWSVVPELRRRRWLVASGTGQVACAGQFLALCCYFDACFRSLAVRRNAEEHQYPVLIPTKTLEKLEFFTSFPQFATYALHGKSVARDHVLSPAVCYHTCNFLRNRRTPGAPYSVTAVGRCFRFEGDGLTNSPERLWDFTMREIVFFGSSQSVERIRCNLINSVSRLSRAVGIVAEIEEATDPFFLGKSRGKRLLQRLKKLKYELRANYKANDRLAVASFNNHEDFFGKRMNIRLPNGAIAHSGCVAFGIERWAFAFLCQNGLETRRWPARLQRAIFRNETC